jgi:hypothetical protein
LSLTDADIDEMLFRQELTPAGAAKLRSKLKREATGPIIEHGGRRDLKDFVEDAAERYRSRRPHECPPGFIELLRGPGKPASAGANVPCAFDGFKDHKGPLGIACPCPRCSPGYLSASIH